MLHFLYNQLIKIIKYNKNIQEIIKFHPKYNQFYQRYLQLYLYKLIIPKLLNKNYKKIIKNYNNQFKILMFLKKIMIIITNKKINNFVN